jgi:hypothetical protein
MDFSTPHHADRLLKHNQNIQKSGFFGVPNRPKLLVENSAKMNKNCP